MSLRKETVKHADQVSVYGSTTADKGHGPISICSLQWANGQSTS